MSVKLTCLKVFIAAPGGLTEERRAFRDEIQGYNDTEAMPRGVIFQAVGWEDTLGGVGRPQSLINEDLRACDYFVLVLWNRWGSPPDVIPSRFSSGTEEEYHVALECYEDKARSMRRLALMFKAVDLQQLNDPGPQLERVLEFRKAIERQKSHLFHTFDTTEKFRKILRLHLAAWLRDEERRDGGREAAISPPSTVEGESAVEDSSEGRELEQQSIEDPVIAKARELANEGRLTEAEVLFARAVVGREQPEALNSYGSFLLRVGRWDQATAILERAIICAKEQANRPALAAAYENLGGVHRVRGDLFAAEEMFWKSLTINEQLGQLKGVANAYARLGSIRHVQGDLARAEDMFRQSLALNEKLGRLEGIAHAYDEIGDVLIVRGDLDGAEEMHRKSLAINEKLGRLEGIANAYACLGNVRRARNDLTAAEEMYRKSLAIEEKLGRLEGIANAYAYLGDVQLGRRDLVGAEEMHCKSLALNERLGRLPGIAMDYLSLGNVRSNLKDFTGAEDMYRKSLALSEKLGRLEGVANAYGNLGNLLVGRGDLAGAEEMYWKTVAIEEKLGRPQGLSNAYRGLGLVLRLKGDLAGAEEMHRKSLDSAERKLPPGSVG